MQSDDPENTPQIEDNAVGTDDLSVDDAVPLCPNCLRPCDPHQYYCEKCGSNQAINPLATYLPWINLRFNYAGGFGNLWRQTWQRKNVPLFVKLFSVFLMILFVPIMLIVGAPFLLTATIKDPARRKNATIAGYIIAAVLVILYLSWSWGRVIL